MENLYEYAWRSRPFKSRQLEEKRNRQGKGKEKARKRQGKGKGKARERTKEDPKGPGRAFFGEEQAQDSEYWSEEDCTWWTQGRKGKKGSFAITSHTKVQARIF